MAAMIGKFCPNGPGKQHNGSMRDARNCHCCGQPPGRQRKLARRQAKRRDRQNWKRQTANA